ncbi:MAG: NAD-dependent epimerase/dehydratase family protein [Cyclobacteriaceae bacterium]|nr:NAD-dependent epimerase/dehydratase family protein [Cyclobacteriaceae bacterium]
MKTSLLTGGAGFIGAHVSRELLKLGHKVIILDDLSGGFEENIPEKAVFIKGSINDRQLVAKLFQDYSFNYVYHLAAYAAEGLSHFIRRYNYENNLIGSINLINESIKYKIERFVFTSSIAVYGKGQLPLREDMVPTPEDPYGVAKFAVEQDLKCAHEMFGLDYTIFRPHNVYGEYQNIGDKYRNVVGIFMNQLMQNKPVTIFGNGEQTRAFSYIGDIAPLMANCVTNPKARNEIINVGADQNYTVKTLAQEVMKAMGTEGEILYTASRNEVMHAWSDHTKCQQIFGDITYTPLPDGLKKMADWAKRTGSKKSTRFENIEILEKLPPIWLND